MSGCPNCGGDALVLTRYLMVWQRIEVVDGKIVGYGSFDYGDNDLPVGVTCYDCHTTWGGDPAVLCADNERPALDYTAVDPTAALEQL